MNDAPPASMLSQDEVDLVDEAVTFYPDSVLRRAVGAPIGECVLAGVRCTFRRASARDLVALEQQLGKKFEQALKDGDRLDYCRMTRFAVTPIGDATGLPDDGADLPFGDWATIVTVLRFFSGTGTLVGRAAAPSKKTTPAESDGPTGP